jgi:predicted lysophospholipase L1 biosynthesis ABC-type transport system permease subunit
MRGLIKQTRAAIYVILGLITNILGDLFINNGLVVKILVFPFFMTFVCIMLVIAIIHDGKSSEDLL